MHKYGIAARGKRKKYVYPGKATEIAPNQLREEAFKWINCDVYFRRGWTNLLYYPHRYTA
jgi:hypothetical protein